MQSVPTAAPLGGGCRWVARSLEQVVEDPEYRTAVRAFSDRIVATQRPIRILDAVKWDESVRDGFFASDCRLQPSVDRDYYRSRPLPDALSASRRAFEEIDRELEGVFDAQDPAGRMMRRMCREYEIVIQMLDARGTPDFHRLSVELFGRAAEPFHEGGPSLVELAELLDGALRKLDESAFVELQPAEIEAERAVAILQERLDRYFGEPRGRVRICLDDGIIADAAAGSDYIKLRGDARFRERDLRVLEVHEGWVHVGTTLNGLAQDVCTFLGKGTPSTTITQEGIALFVEVISFSSYPRRLRRVTDRIRAIHWAEDGASFLEVFERLRGEGRSREEAWPTCVRVFRGSTPELGPFTKDLAYSRGFIEVYNFVRLAVRRGRLDRIRLLFCGKISLGDMADIAKLHAAGLVTAPRHLPPQLAEPSALAAWMAYSNFLNRLDLSQLEGDLARLID
jgi:uncharacterized protein (TIGR02421 family)